MARPPGSYAIEGAILGPRGWRPGRLCVAQGRVATTGPSDVTWRLEPGEALLPAFHDHHTHLVGTFRPAQGPDLAGAGSRAEALDRLASWLQTHPGRDPVLGEGWDESTWADARRLTRADLDQVESDRPIGLRRVCGHLAVVNSAAWRLLAASGDLAQEATGTLTEALAMGLPARWPVPVEQCVQGAWDGQQAAFQLGVTAIDEMGRLETLEGFQRLEAQGRLRLKVRHFLPLERRTELASRGITPGWGGTQVRVIGLKGFLDGSFGARTAAIATAYADAPGNGLLLWETAALREAIADGARAGFTIALHAIGERAVAQAIEVLEDLPAPGAGGAHRIEHAEQAGGAAIERVARSGVVFSMQPNFTARWQREGGLYARALGEERSIRLNRYRSARRSLPVLFGSDTMPIGPLAGLQGALCHPDPAERLSLAEAVAAYAGSPEALQVGARADLVVVRTDDPAEPLEQALAEGTARVVWTAAAGHPVYCAEAASAGSALRGPRP